MTKHYFRSTSHQNEKALVQLMQKQNRLEFLTDTFARYSDKYAYKIPGTEHILLLVAMVLTGVSCPWPADRTLTKPPPKPANATTSINFCNECYDSVHGQTSIYVIYDHEKAYPAYVITYTC